MPYHIPYRGDSYPRSRKKHFSPPTPDEKAQIRSLRDGVIVVGFGLGCFILIDKTNLMVYVLLIYSVFWITVFLAVGDLKKTATITPGINDQDPQDEPDDNDSSSITDDYSNIFEWPYRFIGPRKPKGEHNITLQKYRMKNHGHTMSKHRKK